MVFVGYPLGQKAWRFYNPETRGYTFARDATFAEEDLLHSVSFEITGQRGKSNIIEEPEENDGNEPQTQTQENPGISGEEHEDSKTEPYTPDPVPRRNEEDESATTSRTIRSFPTGIRSSLRPRNPINYSNLSALTAQAITKKEFPKTLKHALSLPEKDSWKEAQNAEIQALEQNRTWEIVDLPQGRKAIDNRWIFTIKTTTNNQELYKAI